MMRYLFPSLIVITVLGFSSNSIGQDRYTHKIILLNGTSFSARVISVNEDEQVRFQRRGYGLYYYSIDSLPLDSILEIYLLPKYPQRISLAILLGQSGVVEKSGMNIGLKISYELNHKWSMGAYGRYEYYYRYYVNNPDTVYKKLNVTTGALDIRYYPWNNIGLFINPGISFAGVSPEEPSINSNYSYIFICGLCYKNYLTEHLAFNSDLGYRYQFPENPLATPTVENASTNSQGIEFRIGISFTLKKWSKIYREEE